MSDVVMKRCSRGDACVHPDGPMLPATTEYFHRDRGFKSGITSICKVCKCKSTNQRRAENTEQYLSAARGRYWQHPKAENERNRIWRLNNPDKERARRQTPKSKTKRREYRQKPENVLRRKIYEAVYYQTPEYKAAAKVRDHLRFARERGLPDTVTALNWQHALDHFGGMCAVCGRPPGLWHTLAADHWIPLTSPDCPGTVPENIIPLCHGVDGCNNSKGNKDAREWLVDKFGKRKAAQIEKRIQAYFDTVTTDEQPMFISINMKLVPDPYFYPRLNVITTEDRDE